MVERASADSTQKLSYTETAGDERVHERKIVRDIITSLAALKTQLAAFLNTDTVTSEEEEDVIYITIEVSDRFNTSLTDAVAKICSKFIEDSTLSMWWGTIGNQQQSSYYTSLSVADMQEIKQNLTKKTFASISTPYTSSIGGVGSHIEVELGDTEELTYTIDEDATDDIEACPSNHCIQTMRGRGRFLIKGMRLGKCNLLLYSAHDELNVYRFITVKVIPQTKVKLQRPVIQ